MLSHLNIKIFLAIDENLFKKKKKKNESDEEEEEHSEEEHSEEVEEEHNTKKKDKDDLHLSNLLQELINHSHYKKMSYIQRWRLKIFNGKKRYNF